MFRTITIAAALSAFLLTLTVSTANAQDDKKQKLKEKFLKRVFDMLDLDKNKRVTQKETKKYVETMLEKLAAKIGKEKAEQRAKQFTTQLSFVFKSVDNADKGVTFDQFKKALAKLAKKKKKKTDG